MYLTIQGLQNQNCVKKSNNKANCWEAIKDFEEAIRLFEEVAKDEIHVSSAYYNIGLAYKEVKEYRTALDKVKLANKSRTHKIYEMEIENLKSLVKQCKFTSLTQDIIQKTHNFQSKQRDAHKYISYPLCDIM